MLVGLFRLANSGYLRRNQQFTGEQNGKGEDWNGQPHSGGQRMSACAEPRPLQIECNDLLFEEEFKFVHLLMDRCDNPDSTVKTLSKLLSP